MSIPDRHHRLLKRLIDQAQPQSFEELQELLNTLAGSPLPGIPEEELTDADRAFDLVGGLGTAARQKAENLPHKRSNYGRIAFPPMNTFCLHQVEKAAP
ncbi:MAG: hypothetical protein IPH16_16755 [Haliscomenobacter sp.]|nr:hypothetical protein [Haliscomenobacter sp.]